MNYELYLELLGAGPMPTEEDVKRLEGFQPKHSRMALAVAWALMAFPRKEAAHAAR